MRALRDRLGTICSNRNNSFLTVSSEKLDWEHLFRNRFGRNMKGNRNCWKRTLPTDLCFYCAKKVPLLCVPRLFLKQLKEHKAKTRGTLRFWKRDVPRVASLKIKLWNFPHAKNGLTILRTKMQLKTTVF